MIKQQRIYQFIILLCLVITGTSHAQTPTPPVPSLVASPVQYNPDQNIYFVPLQIVNPNLINALQVQIINNETQTVVYGPTRYTKTSTLQIPASNLEADVEYRIYIEALDGSGLPLTVSTETYGTITQVPIATTVEFLHQPPQTDLTLTVATVELNTTIPAFIITLQAQNTQSVFQYEVWLQDTNTGLRTISKTFAPPINNQLQLSVSGVANGEYFIVVNAQDTNRQILASSQSDNVRLNIQPNILDSLNHPVAIGLIVITLIILIGLFIRMTRPPQLHRLPDKPTFTGSRTLGKRKELPIKEQPANAVLRHLTQGHPDIFINKVPFVIGREVGDWVINYENISYLHARIFHEQGQYYIEDHSSNGTFLNNHRIPKNQRTLLYHGATVRFASVAEFRFEILD